MSVTQMHNRLTTTPKQMINTEILEARIDAVIKAGIDHITKQYPETAGEHLIEKRPGKRYIKLVCYDITPAGDKIHGSVWGFIEKATGHVYKPASFAAPAKHVRYRLMDDKSYEAAVHNADWYGSWLYMR